MKKITGNNSSWSYLEPVFLLVFCYINCLSLFRNRWIWIKRSKYFGLWVQNRFKYRLPNSLKLAPGKQLAGESTTRRWFLKFQSGDLKIDDQPWSRRPKTVDRATIVKAIADEPRMTTQWLGGYFGYRYWSGNGSNNQRWNSEYFDE